MRHDDRLGHDVTIPPAANILHTAVTTGLESDFECPREGLVYSIIGCGGNSTSEHDPERVMERCRADA